MVSVKGDSVVKFAKRTIISVILIAFVAVTIYRFPDWMFCMIIAAFIALGQVDFFNMVKNKKIFVYKYFGTIAGTLIPVVIFFGNSFPRIKDLEPLLIVAAGFLVFVLQFTRRDNARDHLISTALTVFSLFYISWFFSFFVKLKALENGSNLVFFLVLVTKSADMSAYVIGSRFGKNELIPRISPKKTREGTLGGILVSLIVAVTLGTIMTGFSLGHLIVLGILLATLGQVGDLAESLIKRDCHIKDSGTYLPGIGGALDLIDSLLFAAPVFYFYVKAL